MQRYRAGNGATNRGRSRYEAVFVFLSQGIHDAKAVADHCSPGRDFGHARLRSIDVKIPGKRLIEHQQLGGARSPASGTDFHQVD
jgi:hypothetical protein